MDTFLQVQREGDIVFWTMNDPSSRNALTGNTAIEEIVQACHAAEADPGIKVVVLTAAGPTFSSGGNVKSMSRYQDEQLRPVDIRDEYDLGIQRIPRALDRLPVPIIAAVNGPAIGAGCDLACMCDVRIAATSARFAESFIKVGIVPGDGGAWFLQRVVGRSMAAEMAFTGDAIDAQRALACGLVSAVVADDALLTAARSLAQRIAANPAPTLRITKRLMREGEHLRLDSLLELSAAYQALAHKTAEHHEAVRAFMEKRQPRFEEAVSRGRGVQQ